ncbi:MAG: PIN domain-containing protein, partial [Solirubrobacteraceae bacterium]
MTVLDASTLIAFLDRSDALHEGAVATLKALEPGRLRLSPVTHAEVLVGPARAGTLAATQRALATLEVTEIALPADAAPRL